MENLAPNSKFVGHFTEIIWQSKIKGLLHSVFVYISLHFKETSSLELKATRPGGYLINTSMPYLLNLPQIHL